MRAYVTGASGFIGAHVARELGERGGEVRDEWIDLGDRERLRSAIEGCDAVFHLAAPYSYEAPAEEHERVKPPQGSSTATRSCSRSCRCTSPGRRRSVSSATRPARSGRRCVGLSTTRSVLSMAEPLEELADRYHADEDEPYDEHRQDDVLAFLGDVRGEQGDELEHRRRTLTNAAAMRRERTVHRVVADLAAGEL
jgi:hypothetical protein